MCRMTSAYEFWEGKNNHENIQLILQGKNGGCDIPAH